MGLRPHQLLGLSASAVKQITRDKSRQLARGNETVPQPLGARKPESVAQAVQDQRSTGGAQNDKKPAQTWWRVAARSESPVPIQVIAFKPATPTLPNRLIIVDESGAEDVVTWEADDSVRYFQDLAEGRDWQAGWIKAEINRLTQMLDRILTENTQPENA